MKKHSEAFQEFLESLNSVQSTFEKPGFNLTKFQIQIFSYQDIIALIIAWLCIFLQESYLHKFRKNLVVNSKHLNVCVFKFKTKMQKLSR